MTLEEPQLEDMPLSCEPKECIAVFLDYEGGIAMYCFSEGKPFRRADATIIPTFLTRHDYLVFFADTYRELLDIVRNANSFPLNRIPESYPRPLTLRPLFYEHKLLAVMDATGEEIGYIVYGGDFVAKGKV